MPHFSASSSASRILEPENVDDGEPHHARDVIAVIVKLSKVWMRARLQVGADAFDHFEEILVRDSVALDRIDKGGPQRMIAERGRRARIQDPRAIGRWPPRDRRRSSSSLKSSQ